MPGRPQPRPEVFIILKGASRAGTELTMLRKLSLFLAFALLLPLNARAGCNPEMTMTCNANGCTSVTTNTGTATCSGDIYSGFLADVPPQTYILQVTNTLGLRQCLDSTIFGNQTTQTFTFCFGSASLPPGASFSASATIRSLSAGGTSLASLPVTGFTIVDDPASHQTTALAVAYSNVATPSCTPVTSVASQVQSGLDYNVTWTTVSDPTTQFQIDESTKADFSSAVTSRTVAGTSATFRHDVQTATPYYYRVRALSCGGQPGPYSALAGTVVLAPITVSSTAIEETNVVLPLGSTAPFGFTLTVPPIAGAVSFVATTDKPYLVVTPSSGPFPAQGLTLRVTAAPGGLPPGASTGTVFVVTTINTPSAASGISTNATTSSASNVPVSVTLAAPVNSAGKTNPPSNALIIPVVTHVNGANAPFESDVRLTNAAATAINYQVSFTPTRTNGTQNGKVTQVSVAAGQTIALNDIAKTIFGFGATGDANDVGFGSLELRPLGSSSLRTFASSRTYAVTPLGTYGQFIPAVPLSSFVTRAATAGLLPGDPPKVPAGLPVLSIQQIAQSAKFRTNLGIVEGSGNPATGTINIYNNAGAKLKAVPFSLQAGEHQQINNFLAANGVATLEDGRIEIVLESQTGAVTAYASVVDNITSDPLAVAPVQPSVIKAARYIVPGIADLNTANNFHSDLRIFNGGAVTARVTATYYPQNNGTPVPAPGGAISIAAGETKAYDNVLPSLFNVSNSGGSIVLTADSIAALVATARTYSNAPGGGTFGQFIPGVTSAEGVGLGERPLQILQLEQSNRFRSNIGLSELSGNTAHVVLSLYVPDAKQVAIVEQDLAPNQFLQLGSLFRSVYGEQNIYNGRVTVEVTSGQGRVAAYGSVIDNRSSDPTYVPAQ